MRVKHRERRQPAQVVHHGGERHLRAIGAGDEDAFEVGRVALEFRIDLQHHHVLVALGIDDRDLPLGERVVERVVDVLDPNAEARRLLPVDLERQLQPAGITVAGNVGNAFDRFHAFADDRRPFLQQIEVGARQRILIVGIALSPAGADVLRGEHEQPDSGNIKEIFAQPIDHQCGGQSAPLFRRLEANEHRTAIGAGAAGAPTPANHRADPGNGRIGHHNIRELLLKFQH